MKMYRTAEKNRTNYEYTSVTGEKFTLHPNKDGVTTADIADLHAFDDSIWNNDQQQHRAGRKTVTAVISYDAVDPNAAIFGDASADPLSIFITDESYSETSQTIIATLKNLPDAQLRAVCAVRLKGIPARKYAAMIGKSEASVSKNLKKADAKLRAALGR